MLDRYLPERFEFYHLGNVELSPGSRTEETPRLDDSTAVAYAVNGDVNGVLVVLFEKGLDLSTYMELGNIVASRFATRLGNEAGQDVMISPPRLLERERLGRLFSQAEFHRVYFHIQGERAIPVQTFLAATKESGNA